MRNGYEFIKAVPVVMLLLAVSSGATNAGTRNTQIISKYKVKDGISLSSSGRSAQMYVSSEDWPGVIRAFRDLQSDIGNITGTTPVLNTGDLPKKKELVIAGTIGKSPVIDNLVARGKINVADITGKWECYLLQTVENPFPGVKKAFVIAGSDKRGTIYGIYEISRQAGISPWHWWADVPPKKNETLYLLPVRKVSGEPSVKYRGIFINDEYPALTKWVAYKYGTVTPSGNPPVPDGVANYGKEFYAKIFEVLLRLKGNYLWPAMWNNAFNEDDTLNASLADEYGIVMGTSHQEPMLRAQKEWDRRYKETLGSWSWTTHADTLMKFWQEGIRRNKNYESIITIGLRGADDTEMGPGGAEANISRLEEIVSVQRRMIAEEINPDVTKVPQMWCLYKEVQDYYNAGMRVPDDVTLLWAEDNWGNVRRLPTPEERTRSGGAGIYYHFDYHGGPRSYQWINTNPIPKIWDQMTLAKQYGADRIWIVNVGHFRGYELPTEFFLDLAWDTRSINASDMMNYTTDWAARVFGTDHAGEIADIISKYTRFNGRRKPELLSPSTYSLANYREAEMIVSEYNNLAARAKEIEKLLPEEMHDAYYHLVLFPVKASALVNELYVTAGRNMLYCEQGRALTNEMADRVETLFTADTSLMGYYNRVYAGGKWKHFMDQAHLGYTSWADPPFNSLSAIKLKRIDLPEAASMGVAIEGSYKAWPEANNTPLLPQCDVFNRQERYIVIYNRGSQPFECTVTADNPWILLSNSGGTIKDEKSISVSVDWPVLTYGSHEGSITISGAGEEVKVKLSAFNPALPQPSTVKGFVEAEGYVSFEAEHFTGKNDIEGRSWERIECYGRTLSGMRATAFTDAPPAIPGKDSPCLEYKMYLFSEGDFETTLCISPTLNFIPGRDLRIGLSFDDGAPVIVTIVKGDFNAQNGNREWEKTVMDNIRYVKALLPVPNAGDHTLKIWMIDPGIVLEKIFVNTGGLRPSYLGPPESFRN